MHVQQAQQNLQLLQKSLGERSFAALEPGLLSLLSRAGDPDQALNYFERFCASLNDVPFFIALFKEHPHFLTSLITIFGGSRFLSAFLLSDPEKTMSLLADREFLKPSSGKKQLSRRLLLLSTDKKEENDFFQILRIFRKQEMLRIGLRDLLAKADLRETVEDLSDLAEVCLQRAYEWVDAGLTARYGRPFIQKQGTMIPARFAVIAMGKLGGRELNFSSDVDLMYAYTADGETEGIRHGDGTIANKITNHQYFVKIAERLTAAIGQKTGDGFVFRVDLRLRPEGQRGPLAQSLGGYEIYYESWGQTWERSALIKARPVAGDEALGKEFLDRISPFVFRKYLDYSAIAEIGEMKQKINKDVEQKGRTYRDVKLGYGGIREIEFVIQALQLIYAGRDRSLREKNALRALHTLSQKGLISYEEQSALVKAYVFLRNIEHRIQIVDDLQTQTLPAEESELRNLARRAGYRERGREAALLLADYAEHARRVRIIYDNLFAFTGDSRSESPRQGYGLLLDMETPEEEAIGLLRQHGFFDPGKAYRNLLLLREGTAFVHQTPRSRSLFNKIFPVLFEDIVSSPDPDMALNHFESFLSAQGSWESFQALLRFDSAAGRLLVAIFANSEYFSRMLISRPVLIQNLIESRKTLGAGTSTVFARGLSDALNRAEGITDKLDALRRFKHQEEIRIGLSDLLSHRDIRDVSRDLSKLAEACLDAAVNLACSEVGKRYESKPSVAGLSVIAAGKLGGRELIYGSDLDIFFIYSESRAGAPPPGLSAFEFFSKVAEKTIAYLSTLTREGFAFRVDTRLRPTGAKGPLVQSIEAATSYYAKAAQTWERQALIRARHVAGDRTLGALFCEGIEEYVYQDVDRALLARDVVAMRRRMEEELGKEDGQSYNIKQGAGGTVDVEFIVQLLQLSYGRQRPALRVPGTCNALHALRKENIIDARNFKLLHDSFLFLRRLESRMRIVSNQTTNRLSKNTGDLQTLARRMGYQDGVMPAGQQLLDEYVKTSLCVRELFIAISGGRTARA